MPSSAAAPRGEVSGFGNAAAAATHFPVAAARARWAPRGRGRAGSRGPQVTRKFPRPGPAPGRRARSPRRPAGGVRPAPARCPRGLRKVGRLRGFSRRSRRGPARARGRPRGAGRGGGGAGRGRGAHLREPGGRRGAHCVEAEGAARSQAGCDWRSGRGGGRGACVSPRAEPRACSAPHRGRRTLARAPAPPAGPRPPRPAPAPAPRARRLHGRCQVGPCRSALRAPSRPRRAGGAPALRAEPGAGPRPRPLFSNLLRVARRRRGGRGAAARGPQTPSLAAFRRGGRVTELEEVPPRRAPLAPAAPAGLALRGPSGTALGAPPGGPSGCDLTAPRAREATGRPRSCCSAPGSLPPPLRAALRVTVRGAGLSWARGGGGGCRPAAPAGGAQGAGGRVARPPPGDGLRPRPVHVRPGTPTPRSPAGRGSLGSGW